MQKQPEYAGYDYGVVDNPDGTITITCFPSNSLRCIVVRTPKPGGALSDALISPGKTDYHDEGLQDATQAINEVLARLPERSGHEHLHLLVTERGLMLAWVRNTVESVSVDKIVPNAKAMT